MVTVDRRSECAAALCDAALTPPAACRSLEMKHAAETCETTEELGVTNLTVF